MALLSAVLSFIIHEETGAQMIRNREAQLLQMAPAGQPSRSSSRATNVAVKAREELSEAQTRELQELRAEEQNLRTEIDLLEAELQKEPRLGTSLAALNKTPLRLDSEYYKEREKLAAGKKKDAEILCAAIRKYVQVHDGQYPSNYDQLSSFLETGNLKLSGTNTFELLCAGKVGELTSIFPEQTIILFREREPWRAPSGKWARVYGKISGASLVESEDNFQSWEARHAIPIEMNRQ
jgi:cell division protein FtsB